MNINKKNTIVDESDLIKVNSPSPRLVLVNWARIFVDKYLRDYRESIEHSRSDNGVVTEGVEAGISKSYLGMQKTGHR